MFQTAQYFLLVFFFFQVNLQQDRSNYMTGQIKMSIVYPNDKGNLTVPLLFGGYNKKQIQTLLAD